jgi:hypothetical protein
MNGIDYQQKLNRQNELYQKNIQDNNRSNQTNIDNVKETTAHRLKEQSKAHKTQLDSVNKEFGESVERINEEQQTALKDKSRVYELAIDKNQNEASAIRNKNLKEWRGKFQDIKGEFENTIKRKDIATTAQRENLKKNFDENVKIIRKTADKDLNNYIESVNKKSTGSADETKKAFRELSNQNIEERHKLVKGELRKRNFIQKTAAADIEEYRGKQEKEFANNRELTKNRSDELAVKVNNRVSDEITKKSRALEQAHAESVNTSNDAFTDRYRKLEADYNKDVRKIDTKYRAAQISKGTHGDRLLQEQRAMERDSFLEKQQSVIKERNDLSVHFEDNLLKNTSTYQDKMQDMRIDFSGKLNDTKVEFAERNTKDVLKSRHQREKLAYDHKIQLEFEKNKGETRNEAQRLVANKKIKNLKQDYNRSMNLAVRKSQEDLEGAKEEMMFEKRILQKRLHEQNSHQNSFLKKVYTQKLDGLKAGYEKRIADLESKIVQFKDDSNYRTQVSIQDLKHEMEREKTILQNAKEVEVSNVKRISDEREQSTIKDKARTEALFNQKLNEQSINAHRKVKEIAKRSDIELKNQATKYQDVIDQNNKYFNRELQRLSMASNTERDRLVNQYEEQIVQLKRANRDREDSLKEFNKINS